MKRAAIVLVVVACVVSLVGCLPSASTAPIVSATITTPNPPAYTYAWVMVHHYQQAGFQIGAKVDGSGTHIAIYWWVDCAAAYTPCARWGFHEYDPLIPGSTHVFAITATGTGYAGWCDGRLVGAADLVVTDLVTEVGSEATTS